MLGESQSNDSDACKYYVFNQPQVIFLLLLNDWIIG